MAQQQNLQKDNHRMTNINLGNENLVPVRVLGEGTFGQVYLCKNYAKTNNNNNNNNNEEQTVCVKRIILKNLRADLTTAIREIYILCQLRHPHIVKFMHSYVYAGTINIVMEWLPRGTLRDRIMDSLPFSQNTLLHYFCDILLGLEYLHIRHVLHRDLKPENLLLSANFRIKIADFGISTIHNPQEQCSEVTAVYGTPYYTAPEVLHGARYTFQADIWSLGCILYEMCSGMNPLCSAKDIWELRAKLQIQEKRRGIDCNCISSIYAQNWARLCSHMLLFDPLERIRLPDILRFDAAISLPYLKRYFEYTTPSDDAARPRSSNSKRILKKLN